MPHMTGLSEPWCELCGLPLAQCAHSPRAVTVDLDSPRSTDSDPQAAGATHSSPWDLYLRWNRAIASVIYCPENAGVPVFLDLEEDMLQRAAKMVGATGPASDDSRMELAKAVRATLDLFNHPGEVFASHLARIKIWRTRSGQVPPPIALLAVLSLAAEDMTAGDGLASNNYYDRLMPLIGITDLKGKNKVITAYHKCSKTLWECLNGWLEDLQGERGLPTAYSYTHAHIGRPMSQALIRATDRDSIGQLFGELGLPPRSRITPSDMEPLLAEWFKSAVCPASNSLRIMWRKGAAKDRITEVVCRMLETWEPETTGRTGSRVSGASRQLRLMALLRTFPSPYLELNVTGPGVGDIETLSILDRDGNHVPVRVEMLPTGAWRLANPQFLDRASLLEGLIQLQDKAGSSMERRPRRLVPLRKDSLLSMFVEVERLSLSDDALLFCRKPIALEVQEALALIARPGFRRWEEGWAQSPAEWILFSGIQVLTSLPELRPSTDKKWSHELNCLQALASSQLVLEGGFRFPGRIRQWSSLAPPEIRTGSDDAIGVEVRVEQVRSLGHELLPINRRFEAPVAVFPLESLDLPNGDFEITASFISISGKRNSTDMVRLRLRSADEENPVPRSQTLIRDFSNAGEAVISAKGERETSAPKLRGAFISDGTSDVPTFSSARLDGLQPHFTPEWWIRRQANKGGIRQIDLARLSGPRVFMPLTTQQDCFRTGAHYIKLPTYLGKTSRTSIAGTCIQCGLVKRYPARYSRGSQVAIGSKGKAQSTRPWVDVTRVMPVKEEDAFSNNLVLDVLSFIGEGTSSSLEQVGLQVEPSSLFLDRLTRSLEALGHIETFRDLRSLRTQGWEVTPPTLVELSDGAFSLVGHRSNRLVQAVEELGQRSDVLLERTKQVTGPDRLLIPVSPQVAKFLAEELSQSIGYGVHVVEDAALSIARLLPPLSQVIETLPRQSMPGVEFVRRWNPLFAKWEPASDASGPGVYQISGNGMLYCIREASDIAGGKMRRGDARLVKHAAALFRGEPLVGYDEEGQTLYTPLGADLPLLYERAAVLCSGLTPEHGADGVIRYRGVPNVVADRLMRLLAS